MKKSVIYIHGQGGNSEEAKHYEKLFESYDVIGFDYRSEFPWEAEKEFPLLFDSLCGKYESVILIANSIGAYFAMCSLSDKKIDKAYFISPVVNMRKLIEEMMCMSGVSEAELREKGEVETAFGQTLSWKYYFYAKSRETDWSVPTAVLYGSEDKLTSIETISDFAEKTGASLTVMQNGEHWFHTEEQMKFLDNWLKSE